MVGEGDRLAVGDQLLFGRAIGLNSGMLEPEGAAKGLRELSAYAHEVTGEDKFIMPSEKRIDAIREGMERMMERMENGSLWSG